MSDPVGDWYDRRRKEADAAYEKLQQRIADGAPPDEIRRLKDALEQARYVGD